MVHTSWKTKDYITTWQQFDRAIRSKGCQLLKRLDDFPNSILVTGCQRSGTTMLARIITQCNGMTNYWFGPDDELDAALILSGYVDHRPQGRYCFQTTYINECYPEFYEHDNEHKILWVLRNPFSVTYSMLYNWNPTVLDGVLESVGASQLIGIDAWLYKLFGEGGISRLRRACYTYNWRQSHLFELKQHLNPDRLMVVDYDDLVTRKEIILPAVYEFIDLEYREEYANKIHAKSLSKQKGLTKRDVSIVNSLCGPVYQNAKTLLTDI